MEKAIFAGSFDPITLGHEDILKRASKLCKHLTVGVINNPQKKCMFTLDQRKAMVEAACKDLDNVEIVEFSGLLAKYVHDNGYDAIIRGLRNSNDFTYELDLAHIYQGYKEFPCETVYLMSSPEFTYVSSTAARENFLLGSDISNFVSKDVISLMNKYYSE